MLSTINGHRAFHLESTSSLRKTKSLLSIPHLPQRSHRCRTTNKCRATGWIESWFYLLCLISILTLSDPLAAAPLYISGDDPLPVTHLTSVEPPSHIFKSSQIQADTPSNWYRLDIELSEYSPHDWLMVFRQAPHKKLDIFAPVDGGYHLKKMGVDGSRSGITANAIELDIKPGETKTWYLRHASVPPNQLNPTLWPSLTYFEKLGEQQNTISSIQTLLIVALIFIFTLTLRNRTPALYLLISHMLAANVMILMWEGDIFRVISWLGDPGHWLILMTTLVLATGITSYRTLALLPIYCPRIDRLILSFNALGVALVLYAISSPSPPPSTTMELAASALLASFALVVIASAYCLYNGIRPAKTAFPSALTMLLLLSYSWFTETWPRSLPTYPELLLLSLHAALLPLFYWHSHQQNLQHAMSINAIAPDSRKRRIFETALREHLQNPDSSLSDADITQRVLSTFEEVLPGMPAMVLHHQRDEWHMILKDTEDHSKTADSLRKQLPAIEDDLLNVISSGTETKINFKDQYGTIYWVLPLNIEADDKILMVLSPLRHHRNATTWQTACDISNHACTLLQANRQSLFWRQQASLDPLTGLLNRRAFCLEAEKIIQVSVNNDFIQPCCALFIDIDNFKQLNDQQGHSAGDLVLKNTALLCRKALRHKDLLGRYGGEEFVALLPNTEPWQAFRVAERIRNAIANEATNNSKQANHKPITVSIGISALSSGANTLDKILEEADSAMYRAKQKGKNRTSISTSLTDVRIPLS